MEVHEIESGSMAGSSWRFYLPDEQMPNPAGYYTVQYDGQDCWPAGCRVAGSTAYLILKGESMFPLRDELEYLKEQLQGAKETGYQLLIDHYQELLNYEIDKRLGL